MKKLSVLLFVFFIMSSMDSIHDRKITGHVVSADGGSPLSGVSVIMKGSAVGTVTDAYGKYSLNIPSSSSPILVFSYLGYKSQEIKVDLKTVIDVQLEADLSQLSEVVVLGRKPKSPKRNKISHDMVVEEMEYAPIASYIRPTPVQNTEEYASVKENSFQNPFTNPLSTFSVDVDAASYSNVRRFLNQGQRPPKDAVRVEEMINYFHYDYPQPKGKKPFSVSTEIATAPWNSEHKLVHIGLQGKEIPTKDLPPSNLVFLIDVSGSMSNYNKLPLLKKAFRLLVNKMRPEDNVAIVVYAGAAGEVLPSTRGSEKAKIIDALNNLEAGGSTAGGAGIQLAYKIAKRNFKKDGNNRVILATDGDFNVGASSNEAMEDLIEEKRKDGVFLTVLGFGMRNYKDTKMEILADKGNGNYAYIDNILEAQKVFVHEFGGTLFTIAKDVKVQVEFNPAKVKAYRLVGYENRLLQAEDFNNDKKDAGEIGSGHSVTALYEIIPVGAKSAFLVDDLKYQQNTQLLNASNSNELMTIKLRYKLPEETESKLLIRELVDENNEAAGTSDNYKWSAAVAAFGMMLKDSDYRGNITSSDIIELAKQAKGKDEHGYRAEFIRLMQTGELLASK
ncbi:MAG: von Willebrand factor type A domain-containing protein [Bacteroidota bacterium]